VVAGSPEVRQAALEGAAKAVPRLQDIATQPGASVRDVIGASRVLLEFEVGRQLEVEDTTPRERSTGAEITRRMAEVMPRLIRTGTFGAPELLALRDAIDEALRVRAILDSPAGANQRRGGS
jgi:hypothetical protein